MKWIFLLPRCIKMLKRKWRKKIKEKKKAITWVKILRHEGNFTSLWFTFFYSSLLCGGNWKKAINVCKFSLSSRINLTFFSRYNTFSRMWAHFLDIQVKLFHFHVMPCHTLLKLQVFFSFIFLTRIMSGRCGLCSLRTQTCTDHARNRSNVSKNDLVHVIVVSFFQAGDKELKVLKRNLTLLFLVKG